MRDVEPFVFRTFREEVPDFLRTWRQTEAAARWDRHYLIRPGHSLCLAGGTVVELKRAHTEDGFRVDRTLLAASFPLDWMSLSLVASALPRPFAVQELDGRSAQGFVDSLAFAALPQASVLKEIVRARSGGVTATAATLKVPDWNAASVALTFESVDAGALRSLLSAGGFSGLSHRDLDDWLRDAHRAASRAGATRAA